MATNCQKARGAINLSIEEEENSESNIRDETNLD